IPPTSGPWIGGPVGATVQPASSSPASATGRMITTAATLTPELILPGWCLWRYARRRSPRRQDVFTDSGRDVLTLAGTVSKKLRLSLITAALLFSAFTASAPDLRVRPATELAA